jgi:methionyl-tRNA formyltransferase
MRTPIGARETSGDLYTRLAVLGGEAALAALDLLASGQAVLQPQDATQATYATKIKKEHGLVDWTKSAQDIDRLVRAYTPWPGARAIIHEVELGVLEVEPFELPAEAEATPGTCTLTKAGPVVRCGTGALRLVRVKPAGKGAMDGAAWARGLR